MLSIIKQENAIKTERERILNDIHLEIENMV